jgi:microcystin-dependent protein
MPAFLPAPGVPVGTVIMHAGSVPAGYLECDGRAVSRTQYAALFAAISTLHGAGDGFTTFNLPNCPGRVVVGAGTGTSLTTRTVGDTGGAETHTLSIAEMPAHTHQQQKAGSGAGGSLEFYTISGSTGSSPNTAGRPATTSIGGSGSHNNMQPFVVMRFCIKY